MEIQGNDLFAVHLATTQCHTDRPDHTVRAPRGSNDELLLLKACQLAGTQLTSSANGAAAPRVTLPPTLDIGPLDVPFGQLITAFTGKKADRYPRGLQRTRIASR
jgi:hypothetical protein